MGQLEAYKDNHFAVDDIIDPAIWKLQGYVDDTHSVPAYILATGM